MGPGPHRFGPGEQLGQVHALGGLPHLLEAQLGGHDVGVEARQLGAELAVRGGQLDARPRTRRQTALDRGQVASGEEAAHGPQLFDQVVVAAGGVGLAFEGAQLAAHLAEQVLEPDEAGLGRLQPPLRPSPGGGGT